MDYCSDNNSLSFRFALSLDPENLQAINGMSSLEEMKAVGEAFVITPENSAAPEVLANAPAAPRGRLFTSNDNDELGHDYR